MKQVFWNWALIFKLISLTLLKNCKKLANVKKTYWLFESSEFCFEDANKKPKTTTRTTFRTKTLLFLTNIIYYCTSRPLRNSLWVCHLSKKYCNFNLSLFKFFVSTDVYLIWRKPVCHFYLLLISQNSGKMGKLIFERTNASCSKDNLIF